MTKVIKTFVRIETDNGKISYELDYSDYKTLEVEEKFIMKMFERALDNLKQLHQKNENSL